ncbi:AraC family transcriptional regulator [Paucibacter sp. KCTC 42545]|uniref:AraC family transcriptional regulator n=1 Tax=Paucibacter sp. KCTC 42545 TaxID=1768242 RepID=UPI000733BA67|nr:AraC family transcriptional regulator [Paucibacter sp. KCTC 42545]ALT77910.1 hypothetical protein AT984_12685 [Paucibacter sp. KCTC 42545]
MHVSPAPSDALVHPTYARLLCVLVRSLGGDLDAVLDQAGLSWEQLSTREQMLDYRVVQALVSTALQVSQQPNLGLALGQMAQLSAHGAMGYAVVASRDLAQALATACRYASLRNSLLRFDFELHEPPLGEGANYEVGATLRVHERLDLGAARGFVLDMALGTALRLIDSVVGLRPSGLRVDVPLPAPVQLTPYLQVCGDAQLQFSASHLALHFSPAQLRLPCLTADAKVFEQASQDCEQALRLAGQHLGHWSQRVQAQMRLRREGEHFQTLDEVAKACHVSARTLIRRLRSEGQSFQALLDAVRQEQALWQLRNTAHPIEAIAAQLGFEDASNFARTVRRWYGLTPSALRAQLQGDSA